MDNSCAYLALLLSTLLVHHLLRHLLQPRRSSPPTPFSLPIIGHLHLIKTPLHRSLHSLSLRYGPIFRLQLGVMPVVVVTSPSLVEECLTKNDVSFASRPRTMAADYLTYGYRSIAFAPYGHFWRTLRRVAVVEIFSTRGLQKYCAVREGEVRDLVRRIFIASKNPSRSSKVDLKVLVSLLAFNIMMRTVAGRPCVDRSEADGGEERKIGEMKAKFSSAIWMSACDFLPVLRWFGYGGLEKNLAQLHGKRDELLQGMIEEVRQNRRTTADPGSLNTEKMGSVIETLLALQESEPEFYSDVVVKSILAAMFSAGAETSSISIEWGMTLLLEHPEALQKLRAEIDGHVKPAGRLIAESDLASLPYLRCIVNETLRLFPATPLLLPRQSSDECKVGGYDVPRGTVLLVNAWALHRDPKVWDEPAEFRPERFHGVVGEQEGFRFVPFGAGRRACPGAGMGLRVVSLALGAMVQCFQWEKVEEEKADTMRYGFGLTLPKSKPLEASCSPRRDWVQFLSQL